MPRTERDPQSTLYIRKIPIGTKEDDLREVFSKSGEIKDVYIPRNHLTHEQRGFAYVEFVNKDDAEKALQDLQGIKLMDAELDLDFAKGKRKNPDQMHARNHFRGRDDGRSRPDFRRDRRNDVQQEYDFRGRPIRDTVPERNFARKRCFNVFVGEDRPRGLEYSGMPSQGGYETNYGDNPSHGGRYKGMPENSFGYPNREFDSRYGDTYERCEQRHNDVRGRYEPPSEFRNNGPDNTDLRYREKPRNEPRQGDRFGKPDFRHERPSGRDRHPERSFRNNEGHNMEINGRPRHSFQPMPSEMVRNVRGHDHSRQDADMYYRRDRRPRSGSPPVKRNRFNNRENIM